jgi:hypothetical protein
MTRHTPETLAGSVLLLLAGATLFALSRAWGLDGSMARQWAAFGGPLGVSIGVGMALHGRAMPTTHISLPARAWGLVGSIGAVLNLWTLGYFAQGAHLGRAARLIMPVALVAAWFFPRRFYGEAPVNGVASETTSRESDDH